MRYGIVFGGGGGKGAYEIGVWKALQRLNLCEHFSLAVGTSVGGLNAALFAQKDLEKALSIWKTISPWTVLSLGRIDNFGLFGQNNLAILLRENLRPFHPNDKTQVYICSTDSYIDRRGVLYLPSYHCLNYQRTQEDVINCLLSSAAIPVVFPKVWHQGQWLQDGGVLADQNVPYRFACKQGCDRVLAVSFGNTKVIEEGYIWGQNDEMESRVLTLCPSKPIGNFLTGTLNFSASKAKELIELGETDCMERYKDQILRFFQDTGSK